MSKKTINIDVGADGNITLETLGFKGRSCLEAAEIFKKVLGQEKEVEKTSAFYQVAGAGQGQKLTNGGS